MIQLENISSESIVSDTSFDKSIVSDTSSDESIVSDTSSDESIVSDTSSDEDMNDLLEEDLIDATPLLYELTHEYVSNHMLDMHGPNFHETMAFDISKYIFEEWIEIGMCEEADEPIIKTHCQAICNDYFTLPVAHCRSSFLSSDSCRKRYPFETV